MAASIRKQREILNISQELLAYRAQVSRFRLSYHERGFLALRPEEETALRAALKALLFERSENFFALQSNSVGVSQP
jgi:hypothetical protein